jgi:hypothetical protein
MKVVDTATLDLTSIFRTTSSFQIKLLLHQLERVCIASVAIAFLVVVFLWQSSNHQGLLIWFAAIFVISVIRVLLVNFFYLRIDHLVHIRFWRLMLLILVLLAAMTWGTLAFFYEFSWHPAQQLVVVLVLTLIAAGAIPAYATILPLFISVLVLIFLPLTVLFLLSGQSTYLFFSAALVALQLFGFLFAKHYHDKVVANFVDHLAHHDKLQQTVIKKNYEEQLANETYNRIARIQPLNENGINTVVKPLGIFSGDFIYSAVTPAKQRYILFADVSGHGLPAALAAIPLSSIFKSMTEKGLEPDEIIREINKKLKELLLTGQFCCACFISVNQKRNRISVWNAGLPDILVVSRNSQSIQHIRSKNIPLGIEANPYQQIQFVNLDFASGDYLLACSDGLIEAENTNKQAFGPLLENIVLNNRNQPGILKILKKQLEQHMQDTEQKDDISILEIRC